MLETATNLYHIMAIAQIGNTRYEKDFAWSPDTYRTLGHNIALDIFARIHEHCV